MIRKYLTQQQFEALDNKLNSNVDYVIVENGSPINVSFVTNNITGLDEIYDFAPTPEGSYNITENGEYDVTAYASAYVDVSGVWDEKYTSLFNNNITYLDSTYIPSGTTSLRDGFCYRNSYLTSVDLPNVTNIGQRAFEGCNNLTYVNLPNATYISDYAFYGAHFSSVILPNVTSVGNSAFFGAHSSSVILPNVTSVGPSAFSFSSFTTVDLGPNVTTIGYNAFQYNNNLTSFTCRATTPPTAGGNLFSGADNVTIYVPAESVDTYKAASGWSAYADKIQAIAE